jgi:adenylylsulfate kinase
MYFRNSNILEEHLMFIGRWNPFHDGHKHIILTKMKEHKFEKPALILVRTTSYDTPTLQRADEVAKWLEENNYKGAVVIIPDIKGVYYGRSVGYEVQEIEVSKEIAEISGTKIRELKSK